MLKLDDMFLLSGQSLKLTENVGIKHPTLAEINAVGYPTYLGYVSLLTTNQRDVADILYVDYNVWYEDYKTDWDYFAEQLLLSGKLDQAWLDVGNLHGITNVVFLSEEITNAFNFFLSLNGKYVLLEQAIGDTDKKQLLIFYTEDKVDGCYAVTSDNFKFTESHYYTMVNFLVAINNLQSEYNFLQTKGKKNQIFFLNRRYKERQLKAKIKSTDSVTFGTMFTSVLAKGVSLSDIWQFPIYLFYEVYGRFRKIVDYDNTMRVVASGNYDSKKHPIKWDKIDWASKLENSNNK